MALVARSLQLPANSSGICGTYKPITPGGAPPAVTWASQATIAAALNLLNRPNGTAISENARTHASGAGAAAGTLTVQTVSGDDASSVGGFSISTDNIVSAAGDNGSGVLRLNINSGGVDYPSPNIDWSVVTPESPDTVAPTEVLIKSITAVDVDQVDLEFWPPADVKTVASDADGLLRILLEREIDGQGYSQIAAISVGAGLAPQFVLSDIGSISPSITQTADAWAGTCAGRIAGTSDTLGFVNADITGDFTLVHLCNAFTGVVGVTSMCGLMARASLDANAQFYMIGQLSDSTTQVMTDVKTEYRLTTGGSKANGAAKTATTGAMWHIITRVGDLFTGYYWQAGMAAPVAHSAVSIAMGASIKAGSFFASQDAASAVTYSIRELALNNLGVITYSDTTVADDTTYNYRARAEDLA